MLKADDCLRRAGIESQQLDMLRDVVDGADDPVSALRRQRNVLQQEKYLQALRAVKIRESMARIAEHPKGPDVGLASLLSRDLYGQATGDNVEFRAQAISSAALGEWAEGLSRFRTRNLGATQDIEGLRELVRTLFGKQSDDAQLNGLAKSWTDITGRLKQRFNRNGGDIKHRRDWGLPQQHSPGLLAQAGRKAWRDDVLPLLNLGRMSLKPGDDVEAVLDTVYTQIVTGRTGDDIDIFDGGGPNIAKQRAESRYLAFKNGDAWLTYHDKYGPNDIYTTMTDHLQGISQDIALLEVFGPRPQATYKALREAVATAFAPEGAFAGKRGKNARLSYLDALWNTVSGKVNEPTNPQVAEIANSTRHLLVSAKLGAAFLSAFSDTAFQALARRFNGLPVMRFVSQQLSLMNPKNEADRIFATKLGLGADAWLTGAMAGSRFSDVWGTGTAAKLSNAVMRASMLSSWTDAGRKAFGLEVAGVMAEHRKLSWDQLTTDSKSSKAFRALLERYGFSAWDWSKIQATRPVRYKKAQYLRPQDIVEQAGRLNLSPAAADDLAARLLGAIHQEMNFAVPTPDARVRAVTTGGLQAGSAGGEILRSIFQFKSFPITMIIGPLMRGFVHKGGMGPGEYIAASFVATTVLGAIALQSKEISKGRNPRPMDGSDFWLAAAMQGGGAGLFGDFLFSQQTRFGQGPVTAALGPAVTLADDALGLTLGNVQAALHGDETNVQGDAVDFAKAYLPGTSLWYARAAAERLIFDQLDSLGSRSQARRKWRRIERRWKKEFGQDYYWPRGSLAPEGAPDLGNAAP